MPSSRDEIRDVWGERTPFRGGPWPARVDEHVVEPPERWVQSCCVLCSHGCGMDIGVRGGRIVGVRGRADDRISRGRLGPKGLNGWIANASPDRLTRPLVRRDGKLSPASWDEAMGLVAARTREVKDRYGSGALALYSTGQLFLEEYYTQATIFRGGLGTNHVDGNTRLCTATSAVALMESFGTDGDPGTFDDYDVTDAIFLVGMNMAETHTVLWMRVLDRLRGPNPPKLVVVDPRRTATAASADVHLRPRLGTNVALLNGIVHLLIAEDRIDHAFVRDHTVGFEALRETASRYPPDRVEKLTGVPAQQLRAAARILGTAPTFVSSCLQGVYQANQATAAAVQVNNINLLRGMIGKPGATVFQMNGQPTAQNTRECGVDGELPAMLNWQNEAHVAKLARHWNLHPQDVPHHASPTHVMQIMRYAEEGTVRFLWITATNPAVTLPDLDRIRRILTMDSLFVVVSDAFLTETAKLADVVLPAAMWGEKTGTFTNAERTVHISHKAIDPPGEARSDLDVLLDYARRLGLTDKDGAPLVKWSTAEGAFDHFKGLTRGRPCDYTGITYARLSERSGIRWPCNERFPDGAARLYEERVFNTDADTCESFGKDLLTGSSHTPEEYRARNPNGRAKLSGVDYQPPPEQPDDAYPFWLTTGRLVYHWHTRTKTGRAPRLQAAAPDGALELHPDDLRRLGLAEGDWVVVESRRGAVTVPVRAGDILPGHAFLPMHFGYWDQPRRQRAANELTQTSWDPASKQPTFKSAAIRIRKTRGTP